MLALFLICCILCTYLTTLHKIIMQKTLSAKQKIAEKFNCTIVQKYLIVYKHNNSKHKFTLVTKACTYIQAVQAFNSFNSFNSLKLISINVY